MTTYTSIANLTSDEKKSLKIWCMAADWCDSYKVVKSPITKAVILGDCGDDISKGVTQFSTVESILDRYNTAHTDSPVELHSIDSDLNNNAIMVLEYGSLTGPFNSVQGAKRYASKDTTPRHNRQVNIVRGVQTLDVLFIKFGFDTEWTEALYPISLKVPSNI